MPRKLKKGLVRGFADVTLNDFANSSMPKNRTKKSSNNVNVVLKKEVEKSWDAKDEEDFEGEFVSQEDEDGTISYVIQKVEPKTRRKTLSKNYDSNAKIQDGSRDLGRDYPIDIWYLISDFIRPEDVGTFAAICRTSFYVVCSARFWFGLYRRYYKSVPNMPDMLQPESLIRRYGLKRNVVRALYHMYQPFVNRIKPVTTFEEHPESLKNYECQLFCLHSHSRKKSEVPDLLEILDDISANPEENCRVLEVSCLHYYPIQAIMGLSLKSVSLTLSSAPKFRYHRLQLIFGSVISSTSSSRGGADCITVILDPVSNIKILDWWHPLYPYSHKNISHDLLCRQD